MLIACACALLGMQALAQNPNANSNAAANWTPDPARQEKVAQELELNDTQKTAFFQTNDKHRAQVQAVRNDTTKDQDAKKAELQKIRQSYDTELKGIFTPEQYKEWTELKAQAKEKAKENQGKGKGKGKGKPSSTTTEGTN